MAARPGGPALTPTRDSDSQTRRGLLVTSHGESESRSLSTSDCDSEPVTQADPAQRSGGKGPAVPTRSNPGGPARRGRRHSLARGNPSHRDAGCRRVAVPPS